MLNWWDIYFIYHLAILLFLDTPDISCIKNYSNCNVYIWAASWRKWLEARLPPLGSRVRVSVTSYGFRGELNGVWAGFSRGFSRFPLAQI